MESGQQSECLNPALDAIDRCGTCVEALCRCRLPWCV